MKSTAGTFFFAAILCSSAPSGAVEGFHFREEGVFGVAKVAGDELAHDIYCLTLDDRGRVLVSGPGYIRTLHDRDGDGVFETASDFFRGPKSGCQGMVYREGSLYTTGGRGLERYDDRDGDGVADGPPELLLPLATGGEHTSHALRFGPDGRLYFLGGNYAELPRERVRGFSPLSRYHAGVFCRLDTGAAEIQVWCEGMRNAYDFDFTGTGDIFGWDSDGERDEGLPWYRPCRVYHFTPGADCGWRSSGSGKVPTYALDSVAPVAEIHRGSPTGVACYLHDRFPERYRDGLFLLDWTLGRVYFLRPRPRGASWLGDPELFLRGEGTVSFAPTDVEVAPDGTLLITSGGRGIAGAVYRVSPLRPSAGPGRGEEMAAPAAPEALSVKDVLLAPCPLASWSRRRWRPAALKLGAEPFLRVLAADDVATGSPLDGLGARQRGRVRVRALEILLECYPDLAPGAVALAAHGRSEVLRARAARWAGVHDGTGVLELLLRDPSLLVRRSAAESAMRFMKREGGDDLAPLVLACGRSSDRRLRQAAIACLGHLPPRRWPRARTAGEMVIRGFALARQTPRGELPAASVQLALEVLALRHVSREDHLDALRLLDFSLDRLKPREDPRYTVFDSEWARVDLAPHRELVEQSLAAVRRFLDSPDERLATEAMRLSGRLRSRSPADARRIASRLTADSAAGRDFLHLWFLARLEGEWDRSTLERVAGAGLDLSPKLRRQGVGRDNKWHVYQRGVWERLVDRHRTLPQLLVADPRFGDVDHIDLLAGASREERAAAAERLLRQEPPPEIASRRRILEFVARHASRAARERLVSRLRAALDVAGLRDLALEGLARHPAEADRKSFLDALAGSDLLLLKPSLDGLRRLPLPADAGDEIFELLRWGHGLDRDPSHRQLRDRVAARLESLSGSDCGYRENVEASQPASFHCWMQWYGERHPDKLGELAGVITELQSGEKQIETLLREAPWERGEPGRGQRIFEIRSCTGCHHLGGIGQRVGPDLAGAGERLGLRELLVELILPSRVVPERYYMTEYVLRDGERVEGKQIYSARNALVTVTREGRYRRLDPARVVEATTRPLSLMPGGLLTGLSHQEIADLVAFLRQR